MLAFILLQAIARDGGPVYAESDFTQFIVEPWNAVSALLFLIIVGYWAYKLRSQYKEHLFLSVIIPILAIGGIGGTIYHAFRVAYFYMLMDWVPILILCLAASAYFFARALKSWPTGIGLMLGSFVLQAFVFEFFPARLAINISYILLAALVLVPTAWVLYQTRYKAGSHVLLAVIAFSLAIFFRIADPWVWIPMGTHFLWHLFGALACHCMLNYLYEVNRPAVVQAA